MLNRSASLAMSTSVLKALPGKLDIKRHSPSILYILMCLSDPNVKVVPLSNDFMTLPEMSKTYHERSTSSQKEIMEKPYDGFFL